MEKKTRNLKVCYCSQTRKGDYYDSDRHITVSSIRLKGKWLESYGFEIDDAIQVECEKGRLIITKSGS